MDVLPFISILVILFAITLITETIRLKKEVRKIFIEEQPGKLISTKEVIETPQVNSKKEVTYTKNESLNKVLNETVALSKAQKEEYPTVGGGTFDTSRMSELMGYGKPEEVRRDMVAVDTLQKAGKSVSDVPEHVTNALTRDYSDLMKVMGNKKGV